MDWKNLVLNHGSFRMIFQVMANTFFSINEVTFIEASKSHLTNQELKTFLEKTGNSFKEITVLLRALSQSVPLFKLRYCNTASSMKSKIFIDSFY